MDNGSHHNLSSTSSSSLSVKPAVRAPVLLAVVVFAAIVATGAGCRSRDAWRETVANDTTAIDHITRKVDRPVSEIHPAAWSQAPITFRHQEDLETIVYRDLSLDEVLKTALQNSDVLRKLGGRVLTNPDQIYSRYSNALAETSPRFGAEAALSAFDAQLRGSAYFNNNDQRYNNPFSAGGVDRLKQDLHEYTLELSKLTATGSRYALRSMSIHDANNAPGNTFRSAWDTYLEGEVRKPLLQGGGLQFNRIAGPGATPGVYNGVLLAKVSIDMNQTDFEAAVRDYVNDVTNAYWDLYFAYRDLDARSKAMKRALEAWNRIKARQESDLETGAAEALAREQYFRFKAAVDQALSGRVTMGTRTGNGSMGGTMEASGGVQTTERRLRLLIGLRITDGELLRPADEPTEADIAFDWDSIQRDALRLRPELRKRQMAIRKREMELLAARNFLNPRLDAVGRYRFRGFGDDLLRTDNNDRVPTSAVRNMMGGDHQEWYLGIEYEVPIGYRKANLAVDNAELRLCRERIIQREQQREAVHNLSNSVTDASRAYRACQNNLNRLLAAHEVLAAYEAQDENDMDIDVDHLLDAQRKLVETEIQFYRARTEYALALKNVHYEKGSLMEYHNLHVFDHQGNSQVTHVADDVPVPDVLHNETSELNQQSTENVTQSPTGGVGPEQVGHPGTGPRPQNVEPRVEDVPPLVEEVPELPALSVDN